MSAPLTLLHRDDDLVAIDKPPGLLVHPSALDAHETRSALTLLRAQLGGEPLWPLHRLDKATSGVLLFARQVDAARRWGRAFEQGAVRKHYLALVRGWPPEAGEIDHPLARDPERPSQGQPHLGASTRYRRLACFEWPFSVEGLHAHSRYALMLVEPLTGRRHQIRRHFKHIAHPLIGDTTHGKSAHNHAVAQWLGAQRLWLHALRVEGPHDAGLATSEERAAPTCEGRPPAAGAPRRRVIEATPGSEWQGLLAATTKGGEALD